MPTTVTSSRDLYIDMLRAGSVAIVVLTHWLGAVVLIQGNSVVVEIALGGWGAWVASWILQIMPVVFLAGGVANAAMVGKMRERGQTYAEFLSLRARRLMAPLAALVAVVAVVSLIAVALGVPAIGEGIGLVATKPLWFIAVYLFVTALAPLMVVAQERFGVLVPGLIAAAVVTVDAIRFGGRDIGAINLALVWLFAHQLGIVYASGWLRDASSSLLFTIVAVSSVIGLVAVTAGPYPPAMIGLRGMPVSNLAPPTAMLALLSFAQLAVIIWVGRQVGQRLRTIRWQRAILLANRPIMTIYLWHIPAMMALVAVALSAPQHLLPRLGPTWWLSRPLWLLACSLVLAAIVAAFLRFESISFPTLPAMPRWAVTSTAVLGATIAVISTYQIWRHGAHLIGPGMPTRVTALAGLALSLVLLCPQGPSGTGRTASTLAGSRGNSNPKR
jgi:Acyltransferase family